MQLAWFLAVKFLREHRAQTTLTMLAVAVGVAVMVFLSALISGLQSSLIQNTLGTQAHIVVRPQREQARPLREGRVVRRIERPAQRILSISQWQRIERQIARSPDIAATSPIAIGNAFVLRANASRPVVLLGAHPEQLDRIVSIDDKLIRGVYRLNGAEAVIGLELADDLGVDVGDKFRVQTPEGRESLLLVRGIFDLGNQQVNQRWVVVPLRTGQTLLDLPGGANALYIQVRRTFDADKTAARIAAQTGLAADSWMETNAQLLVALRSQSSSSYTIQFFVFLAVAMGIASVLVVSVVQRTREIGILRAMGSSRGIIAGVFVIQGAVVGLLGSLLGCGLGAALSLLFVRLVRNPDGSVIFPMELSPALFAAATGLATLTGVVAAVLPARRAGALEPVEAIRHV